MLPTGKPLPDRLPTTEAGIKALALPPGKADAIVFHAAIPGLGLRLRGATKRWVLQYRDAGGASRRLALGAFPAVGIRAAEEAARVHLGAKAKGNDPAKARAEARAEAEAAAPLSTVLQAFLDAREGQIAAGTLAQYRRGLTVHLAGLGKLGIARVDAAAIAEALDDVAEEVGPIARNRAHAALAAATRWAAARGAAPVMLAATVAAIPRLDEAPRDRVLTDAELAAIWKATADRTLFNRIVRVLLLSGCRRSEVGGWRWSWMEDNGAAWLVMPRGSTKGGVKHPVPLLPAIQAELPERQPGRDFIFGEEGTAPFSGWSAAVGRLRRRVAEVMEVQPADLAPFGLHDFRRTLATRMNDNALAPAEVVERVLGHVIQGVRAVYDRAERRQDRAEALAAWHRHLSAVCGW